MSRDYYSEINLHLVWHTKNSLPLLTPTVEPLTHRLLRKRIIDTPEVFVHEIGGTETHVHLAVTIPPTLTVSEWIGQMKGGNLARRQSAARETPEGAPVAGRLRRGQFRNGRSGVGQALRQEPARASPARQRARPAGTDYAV